MIWSPSSLLRVAVFRCRCFLGAVPQPSTGAQQLALQPEALVVDATPVEGSSSSAVAAATCMANELCRLAELHESGSLTGAECAAAKQRLLSLPQPKLEAL